MKKARTIIYAILIGSLTVSLLSCGKKLSEQEYFDQAKAFERDEEFNKAAETYLTLYKRYPTSELGDEALFQAAMIQNNQLKMHKRAIETHKKLLRAFPDSKLAPQSKFMIGFIYANEIKDYEKAKDIYTEFVKEYPDHELVTSVNWELHNLGKDINQIDFLAGDKSGEKKDSAKKSE